MKASFLIVNWNTRELTAQAIQSILTHEEQGRFEIIVVDNASSDGSAGYLRERFPEITVLESGSNLGFAGGNNLAAGKARGDWLVLFNSDAYLTEPVLPALLRAAQESPGPCLLTCRLRYGNGSPQLSGLPFPGLRHYAREILSDTAASQARLIESQERIPGDRIEVDWITGAFLMVPRDLYIESGGLDAGIFMYAEDVDFCRRAARRGAPRFLVRTVSAVHLGGASLARIPARTLMLTDDGRLAYFRRWHGRTAALALRLVFLARSLSRLALFAVAGIALRDRGRMAKAGVHARGALHLLLGV